MVCAGFGDAHWAWPSKSECLMEETKKPDSSHTEQGGFDAEIRKSVTLLLFLSQISVSTQFCVRSWGLLEP